MLTKEIATIHYCPVCYKEIPEEAYTGRYMGCIEFSNVTSDGWLCTGYGTIKLGKKPNGEFRSLLPKESFDNAFNAIRARQQSGSVRISRCK